MTATCKLGEKGCWNDGKCRATSNCENKVFTNADRIRAMSDEELAEMLLSACVYREFCHGCIAEKDMPNCPGEILGKWEEWLKQPAEGE